MGLIPLLLAIALITVVEPSCRSVQVTKTNAVDHLQYVRIPGGTFLFGCSAGDPECFSWEKRPTRIYSKAFWIGQTEVTQRAFEKVMSKNPSLYRGASRPVDRVGWNDAAAFCKAVGMRLPTGIEWEYAARGGASTARYGKLYDIAWFDGNSGDRTHEVAQKAPNRYCLYDMLGNVWEWVQDVYEAEPNKRVLRGGSFYNPAREVRVSDRLWATPDTAHRDMGFRCAGDEQGR